MFILLALILFLMLFALMFTLNEQWEKMRGRVIGVGLLSIALVVGTLFLLRYWIVNTTGCIPECAGINLVGRNLHGMKLNGANFVEANLSSVDLGQAQLDGADFSGSTLVAINLQGANLQNSFLLGANLTGANLAGANLTSADLSGADLTNANLTGVDLTQTVLKGARLNKAALVGVNLTNAQLSAVELAGAKMNGAQLANANLSGAALSQADLSGAHLTNSNLTGAWLNLSSLIGADLTNSNLSGASLIGADMASADLTASRLTGSNLVGADLKGSNLNAADLRGVTLELAALAPADLQVDPRVSELNELQRSQILTDASLAGVGFDSQTVWPNAAIETALNAAQPVAQENNTPVITDTIKIGLLHSLSGPLALSELPVRDAELLAIDEINAAGGVLGKPLTPILEDGASDPVLFAEKARKLLEKDQVAVLFGSWSSASRKAVLPVVEELQSLLFYPSAYEGFENSSNIFYIGAEASQQIVPAVDYLLNQNHKHILLIGSDDISPRTINAIIKAQLAYTDVQVAGEVYFPLDATDFSQLISQLKATPPDAIFNTLSGDSNVPFFQQLAAAGFTAKSLPVMSASIGEEEVRAIGPEVMAGQLVVANYYQTVQTPENFAFVTAFKTAYGQDRVTSDPVETGYTAVYLWKTLVEQAKSIKTADLQKAAATDKIQYAAPEGPVRIDGKSHHVYKTARIGIVRDDGLIDTLFASAAPLKPDPFLKQFKWADGLQQLIEKTSK